MGKSYISKLAIVLVLIICAWYGKNLNTWGKNKVIQNDVIMYYAYLPATFIFNDLNFEFTTKLPADFEGQIWLQTSPTGKPILRMTMGMAILWIPFFLGAHAMAHLLGVSTLGYSWPYSFSIFLATLFYLFLGLFFLRKLLLRYFSDITTAIVLIMIVMATNMMFYVIAEPGMTHVYNFGLISTFIYLSLKWIEIIEINSEKKSGHKQVKPFVYSILLGLLAGIIVLIRPVNIIVLVFPALIGVTSFTVFLNRIRQNWILIFLAGTAAFFVILPQMLYWKAQTGHYIFNSYMDQGKFFFLEPQIINGLFSYRKGWLIYTPVMILAIFGFFWLRKYASNLFLPILIFTVINIYMVYSWWCWWYGGSYGSRPMIDMYGIMAIPMAAILEKILSGKIRLKSIAAVLLLGLIWLNQFQMNQYRTSLLHWDSMTKEAYWGIFGKKTWPEGYDKMIKVPDYEKALRGEKEY
ncbi:MAG TPA: hypothetical protein PLC80_18825 [Draconibacterium sp.]|nr:hypothetical protein [Draconibacterium sp.]